MEDLHKTENELDTYINESNSALISEINTGLTDSLKTISEYSLTISELMVKKLVETKNIILPMIEPLTEFAKQLTDYYEPLINGISSFITKIFENIDWTKFDIIFKMIAVKHLSNGFYPYRRTTIEYKDLVKTNSKNKQVRIIKDGVRRDIKNNKKNLFIVYPQYKKYLEEIYKLYKIRNYRLCILSLINLISIINNSQFEYIDFTERKKVRKKLLEKQIMKNKETNYLVFAQFIQDDDLVKANELIKNYSDTPKEYSKVPYNRNAIIHGYSKKFGNEVNCLRWFSVLFNALEISEKLMEVEKRLTLND